MKLKDLLEIPSSTLLRAASFIIILIVIVACAVSFIIAQINNAPLNQLVSTVLGGAFTISIGQLFLQQGVHLTNSDTASAIKQLAAKLNQESNQPTS